MAVAAADNVAEIEGVATLREASRVPTPPSTTSPVHRAVLRCADPSPGRAQPEPARQREIDVRLAPRRYNVAMDTPPLMTAADMEQLSPNERDRLLNDRVITDLSQVSPEFRERILAKGKSLLAERGLLGPDES